MHGKIVIEGSVGLNKAIAKNALKDYPGEAQRPTHCEPENQSGQADINGDAVGRAALAIEQERDNLARRNGCGSRGKGEKRHSDKDEKKKENYVNPSGALERKNLTQLLFLKYFRPTVCEMPFRP